MVFIDRDIKVIAKPSYLAVLIQNRLKVTATKLRNWLPVPHYTVVRSLSEIHDATNNSTTKNRCDVTNITTIIPIT